MFVHPSAIIALSTIAARSGVLALAVRADQVSRGAFLISALVDLAHLVLSQVIRHCFRILQSRPWPSMLSLCDVNLVVSDKLEAPVTAFCLQEETRPRTHFCGEFSGLNFGELFSHLYQSSRISSIVTLERAAPTRNTDLPDTRTQACIAPDRSAQSIRIWPLVNLVPPFMGGNFHSMSSQQDATISTGTPSRTPIISIMAHPLSCLRRVLSSNTLSYSLYSIHFLTGNAISSSRLQLLRLFVLVVTLIK